MSASQENPTWPKSVFIFIITPLVVAFIGSFVGLKTVELNRTKAINDLIKEFGSEGSNKINVILRLKLFKENAVEPLVGLVNNKLKKNIYHEIISALAFIGLPSIEFLTDNLYKNGKDQEIAINILVDIGSDKFELINEDAINALYKILDIKETPQNITKKKSALCALTKFKQNPNFKFNNIDIEKYNKKDICCKNCKKNKTTTSKKNEYLPSLWIILQASEKQKKMWKTISINVTKGIINMYNEGRLNKNRLWFSYFRNGILSEPIRLKILKVRKLEKIFRNVRPYGATENNKLLQQVSCFSFEKANELFKNKFYVHIISPLQEVFLEQDENGNFTSKAKDAFILKNQNFIDWLSLNNLFILSWFDLDFNNHGVNNNSFFMHILQFFDKPFTSKLRYYRVGKHLGLKQIF